MESHGVCTHPLFPALVRRLLPLLPLLLDRIFRNQQARRPIRDPPLDAQDHDALLPGVGAGREGWSGLEVHRVLRLPRQGAP